MNNRTIDLQPSRELAVRQVHQPVPNLSSVAISSTRIAAFPYAAGHRLRVMSSGSGPWREADDVVSSNQGKPRLNSSLTTVPMPSPANSSKRSESARFNSNSLAQGTFVRLPSPP